MAKKLWWVAILALCAGCASKTDEDSIRNVPCTSGTTTVYCTSSELCCSGTCVIESDANCGACGNDCTKTGNYCSNGVCTCRSTNAMCSGTCCSTGCSVLANDPNNCGACGIVVPKESDPGLHLLSSKCDNGTPKIICQEGWIDADQNIDNGCEKETTARCGNGIIEEGEVCDGNNLNGESCGSLVGEGSTGPAYCSNDCKEFETSLCTASLNCGNGKLDPGELCDGVLLSGVTCESLVPGSYGAVRCAANCMAYDLSLCSIEAPCGNGKIDAGELCDGSNFAGKTCASVVGPGSSGQLKCTSDCKLSTLYCSAPTTCGNGIINEGEVCDGANLRNETCESVVGKGSTGTLRCASNCSNFDISGCTAAAACGNGVIESGELCDSERLNDKTCATEVGQGSNGTLKCAANCMEYDKSGCSASTTCGNGVIDGSELCDGTNLKGETCESLVGKGSVGNVLCAEGCAAYNLSQCSAPSTCGNNKLDDGELCDGALLNNATCASIVGKGSTGTIACAASCYAFDTSKCSKPATCGNGVIDQDEVCDATAFAGRTCESEVGYKSTGTLKCATNCASIITTGCSPAQTCGNGKLDADEVCDGTLLNNATCASLVGNGSTGTPRCNPTCTGYEKGSCTEATKCGNGKLDDGEVCDGSALNNATCASIVGFGSVGSLLCNSTCSDYITTGCSPKNLCGNGKIDSSEECDTKTFNGATCASVVGKGSTGDLSCDNNCKIVSSACTAADGCGNNRLDSSEPCDGAHFADDVKTCAAYNPSLYSAGSLKCASNCSIDTSACTLRCGNGIIDSGEECDGTNLGSATCSSLLKKTAEGKLSCTSNCRLDASACQYCGDGVRNQSASNEEECDGSDSLYTGCEDVGAYSGGTLGCTASCEVDVSQCIKKPYCGDGSINAAGEVCDSSDFNGKTCSSVLGVKATGSLRCMKSCTKIDDAECVAVDGCTPGAERCEEVDSVLQYQLCGDHGIWAEDDAYEVCDAPKTACNPHLGCYDPSNYMPANPAWCVFQYLDPTTFQGYGRILMPDGYTAENDVFGVMACTQDLSVPVQDWPYQLDAEYNTKCDTCYDNSEFMTKSFTPSNTGTYYCTFVFDFVDHGMYACIPEESNGQAMPILLDATTTLSASQTRSFTK